MLKRQLEDKDKVILEKEDIIKVREKQIEDKMAILGDREIFVRDLTEQLEQKTKLIETLQGIREVGGDGGSEVGQGSVCVCCQGSVCDCCLLFLEFGVVRSDRRLTKCTKKVNRQMFSKPC